MSAYYRPLCPKCQTTMMLALITRSPSGFDRTFECLPCDHVQRVAALVDPMKCHTTAGWFRGLLRAPT